MTGTPLVVLDACVLANFSLCDTLLRLAEPPQLYDPKWSEDIIRETTGTLDSKFGWPSSLTAYLEAELRAHFGEAWISGYEELIPHMKRIAMSSRRLSTARCPSSLLSTFATSGVNTWSCGASARCTRNLPERDLPTGTIVGHDETGATGR